MLARDAPKLIALAALASLALGILWSLEAALATSAWDETTASDAWGENARWSYEPLPSDGGAPLAMGEPGYFASSAPTVRIHFNWTIDDSKAQRITAIGSMKLHIARDGWSYEEEIANASVADNATQPLAMDGLLDLGDASANVAQTPGHDASGAAWTIVSSVRFASTPTTNHAADASAFEMPLTYTPPLYTLPHADALAAHKDHTQHASVHHETRAGIVALRDQPLGPVLALVGITVFARTLPRLAIDETEPKEERA